MPRIKFNHVFFVLMFLACLSAFVVPQRYTDKIEPQIQGLFAPVSIPGRWAGAALERRMTGPVEQTDTRPLDAIREENDFLLQQNAWLTQELDEERKLNEERDRVGVDVRKLCTPVPVVGTDSATGESLAVAGSSLQGLKDGMYVLYSGGIVGTLQRAGLAGGQVRLITNKGYCVIASFTRPGGTEKGQTQWARLGGNPVSVVGNGQGMMVCQMISVANVAKFGIRVGDWVMLDDPDWPKNLQNRRIGKVVSIDKRKDAPLYAEIRIRPESDLKKLKEVMVLTRN
jgi:cell shape-determining protein MreC